MKLCIHLTLLLLLAATTGKAPGQDLTSITRQMSAFYESIQSISTTTKVRSEWMENFVRYRQKTGEAVPAHLNWSGELSYTAKGPKFSAELKSQWGNDVALEDSRFAWDGTHWESLNKLAVPRPSLELSSKRRGGLELSAHTASVFDMGLPFLLVATPHEMSDSVPEDDYLFRVTLDKVRDAHLWDDVARRLVGQIEPVVLAGQACLKFRIDGGVARGDRVTKIFYDIWVPVDNPIFPVKHETRSQAKDILLARFEVIEFFDGLSIAGQKFPGFPKRYRVTSFTDDPVWLNKPYQVDKIELSKCEFNMAVSDDAFKIDPALAYRVDLLDTKKTIYNEKAGK